MISWDDINEDLRKQRDYLALEKEVDYERYQKEMSTLNQKQKVAKGLSWHPTQLFKKGFAIGNRAFIVLKRRKQDQLPHKLRAGAPVIVFPTNKHQDKNRPEKNGVVNFVDRHRMKIILNTEELPFWIDDGELSVELLFDERTYREMEKALHLLLTVDKGRLKQLKGIFYGLKPAEFETLPNLSTQSLNASQHSAVQHIVAANDVAIVHGPPGTGKTTTLVEAIRQLAVLKEQVLVCAASNSAVDLMAERCAKAGLNVVRIGNISRVDEAVLSLTLDVRLNEHPESKHIKKVRLQANELRRKTGRFKKWGQRSAREENIANLKEVRELNAWARKLEDRLLEEVLFRADVIACTLVNSTHSSLRDRRFKVVIIDEAAQALTPASWIPILRADKVVLAGDPCQLPPTVKSMAAQKAGFDKTLLELAIGHFPIQSFLDTQYRMNERIMQFSNAQYYEGRLKAAEHVRDWKVAGWAGHSLIYIDTAGCGFEEEQNAKSLSRFNPGEYHLFREHVLQLIAAVGASAPGVEIGFISPYKEQVMYVTEQIAEESVFDDFRDSMTVNTIDGFQGQERDVIYISLVRSNSSGEIGFLKDYRRMNTALTRAKKLLVVIGDSATIGMDKFFGDFLDYVDQAGDYQTGWGYMA